MRWHPDVPDLPIAKPKRIEALEQMDPAVLDSLPGVEVTEIVEEVAHAVGVTYKEQILNGNAEECRGVIAAALMVTGGAIGTQVGRAMIASSEHMALFISRELFFD